MTLPLVCLPVFSNKFSKKLKYIISQPRSKIRTVCPSNLSTQLISMLAVCCINKDTKILKILEILRSYELEVASVFFNIYAKESNTNILLKWNMHVCRHLDRKRRGIERYTNESFRN